MPRQRQDYLTEAKDWLNRLELSMAGDASLRHQDSHIELESFFRDLLNLLFGWHLDNANTLFGKNQDSFDLSDNGASLAVQVTVTTTADKIRKTLETFVGRHGKAYRRLLFVYPITRLPESRADFSHTLKGFDFDAGRDRLGFDSILKQAQGLTIEKLEQLIQLLRNELRPLGAALPLGDNPIIDFRLQAQYADWVHETSSTFFVPGLNVTMPIDNAWVRLKLMKGDESIVGTKSSLDEQFQNYREFGQRVRADSRDPIASDSVPLTHSRTVIIGGPGDGKSTMLKRFSWRLSRDKQIVVRVRLPIVLRSMLSGRTFEEAVRLVGFDGSGISESDADLLLRTADVLLCDGLDECDPHRSHVAEQIIRWSVGHHECRIFVSTRPVGHETTLLPGFTHFALQPPEDGDIHELSRKLFVKASLDTDWSLKWAEFLEGIDAKGDTLHFRKLASRNPLLLGFLVRLALDGIDIGTTRSDLYSRIYEIIAQTLPSDRDPATVNARVACEAANALAWKQTLTPFCSADESLGFVSQHLCDHFGLDVLKADEGALAGVQFWQNRRLVETVCGGNDARTFFIHLSLQEFAAARYARTLDFSQFGAWIREVRRRPSWKQVILLLADLDDDTRTVLALLELDDPVDPVSCEAFLAAEAFFEKAPPNLTVLPGLLESLANRFWSDIPLISVEAACQLARIAPFAKPEILRIAEREPAKTEWSKLGTLMLRVWADDSKETVEEFKAWFRTHEPIFTFGGPHTVKTLPDEARDLQDGIVERGLERMIASHSLKEISEYFQAIGELGNFPAGLLAKIQDRLTEIGLQETAKSLWKANYDTSWVAGIGSAAQRWRQGETNLLKLIVLACETPTKAKSEPPFLVLSVFIAALQYWDSTARALAALENIVPSEDQSGVEVIRALAAALKLNPRLLGEEAQAAVECCAKGNSSIYHVVEHASSKEADWAVLTPDRFNPKLVAQGLLHPLALISMAAANAIYAGFARREAAELIPAALHAKVPHIVLCAAAIAEKCLGNKAIAIFLDRLKKPIYLAHHNVFQELARHCRNEERPLAIKAFFSWLNGDNPEVATAIAKHLGEFNPPLGVEIISELRMVLDYWTKRGAKGDKHETEVHVVPPSPRAAIIKELIRLDAVNFDELVALTNDERNDVSELASNTIVERAAAKDDTFSQVLERIANSQLSPRILDKVLKLPIQRGSAISIKAERLLKATDLQMRLATIGQLTGEWIDRAVAIKYLRNGLGDEEPAVRTLATRVLRLIDANSDGG